MARSVFLGLILIVKIKREKSHYWYLQEYNYFRGNYIRPGKKD